MVQFLGATSGIASIQTTTFYACTNLTNIEIPVGVRNIHSEAFADCFNLTHLTIPSSVTNIASDAFDFNGLAFGSSNTTSIFFNGNAPNMPHPRLFSYTNVTAYYLPNTTGWSNNLAGIPTILWNPQIQSDNTNFGLHSHQFGFNVTGTPNIPIVIEASTGLSKRWQTLQSIDLTNGFFQFSDSQWSNYSTRYYRIRSP